ncbi:peptide chain release factor 1 [Muricoccus radiodurans]
MTERETERALDELDRLINDPDVPLDASRVWALAGKLSAPEPQPSPGR